MHERASRQQAYAAWSQSMYSREAAEKLRTASKMTSFFPLAGRLLNLTAGRRLSQRYFKMSDEMLKDDDDDVGLSTPGSL